MFIVWTSSWFPCAHSTILSSVLASPQTPAFPFIKAYTCSCFTSAHCPASTVCYITLCLVAGRINGALLAMVLADVMLLFASIPELCHFCQSSYGSCYQAELPPHNQRLFLCFVTYVIVWVIKTMTEKLSRQSTNLDLLFDLRTSE